MRTHRVAIGRQHRALILAECERAIAEDDSGAIVLGCAGMAAKIKPVPLAAMAARYAAGELAQVVN